MHPCIERSRPVVLAAALVACSAVVDGVGGPSHGDGGGGQAGLAGRGGSPSAATGSGGGGSGNADASGGAGDGVGGSSGAGGGDAGSGGGAGATPGIDAGAGDVRVTDARGSDAPSLDAGSGNSDGGFVGPVVPPDCPGDPTEGWTEYADKFRIEHPYDLQESDRFKFENGIYTFWIFPNDKPHAVGNTTEPRTETHYTNFKTGQHMWTADVLVETPSQHTTIFQVHTTATGAGPVYIRMESGNIQEIDGSVLARGMYDKWFNLKVAFEAATSSATIYINNCQKLVLRNSRPGSRDFYFKNGVYTCESSICRDHYKNVHLYQK